MSDVPVSQQSGPASRVFEIPITFSALVRFNGGTVPPIPLGTFVNLQAATPGVQQVGHLNINGTSISGVTFVGTGGTVTPAVDIATTAIIGRTQPGESTLLTVANTNMPQATNDTALISFTFGTNFSALAAIGAVLESAGPAQGGIRFTTFPGGEKHRMRSDGRFGLGIHSPFGTLHACSMPTFPLGAIISEQDAAGIPGTPNLATTFFFRKERGSIDTPTVPVTGDEAGTIMWTGYGSGGGTTLTLDQRIYINSAQIKAFIVGTVSPTRMPGLLTFSTATDVAASALVEAMRIDQNQLPTLSLGSASPTAVRLGGAIFSQTANSVTTANVLSTLFGTGVPAVGLTLPANILTPGRMIRIMIGGFVSAATPGATHTLTLLLGGVTVATGTSLAVLTSTLNAGWQATALITCRTSGAAGTVVGVSEFQFPTGATESVVYADQIAGAAANTTIALVLDLQLNNGNIAGTYTTQYALVEIEGG